MKGKLTLENGKEVEVTINEEQLKEICKPKSDRVKGEDYWHLDAHGVASRATDDFDSFDDWNYNSGNYFKTKEEAEFHKEKLLFTAKYKRRVKELNGDWVDNWSNENQTKYCLVVNYGVVKTDGWSIYKHSNLPHFKSREIAEQLIKEFGEEGIKKYLF